MANAEEMGITPAELTQRIVEYYEGMFVPARSGGATADELLIDEEFLQELLE